MKYVRRASASLAVALTLSLLVSCGGKGGSGSSGTTPPSTGDHTAIVGGIVIEPSLGDASVTAEPETAPVILPADEPTAGDYAPTGETVITLGDGISVEGDGGYGVTISGGLLLAVGSSGMAESAENNGQAVLAASWRSGGLSAGSTIGIVDGSGRVLAAFELPKAIQSIVFSCGDLVGGQTYSIVGGGVYTGTATDGVIDPDAYTGYESLGEIKAN